MKLPVSKICMRHPISRNTSHNGQFGPKKFDLFREVHGFMLFGDQLLGFWIGMSTD